MALELETQDGYWVFIDTNTGKEVTAQMSTADAVKAMLTGSIRTFRR